MRWYTFRLAEHYFWYTFSLAYAPVSRLPRLRQKNTLILDNKNQNGKQNLEIAGFMSDHLQINYPISPKVSLKIFRKEVPNYKEFKNYNNCLVPIPRKDVILQDNIMQFLMSYRQVFIPQKPENSNEIIKKIKEIDIENFNGPII